MDIPEIEKELATIDLKALVNEFGTKISRLSHRMIFDYEAAREAAQEVWYEILKNIDTFKGNSGIATWIYTIARRTILRAAKSEILLREKELNNHFNLDQIEYSGSDEEKRQWVKEKCDYCLTAFCHCLNNEARLIVLFSDIAELSYEQISVVMEMSEANIRQIASRSRKKIRNFMERDCILYNSEGNCRCRIRTHVMSVDLEKEYENLSKAVTFVDLFRKFDRELPRKNYWEKMLMEDVTNKKKSPQK